VQPGDILDGRFLLEARAASGGMGTVFQGRDARTSTVVAIKVLEGASGPLAERFEREARLLRELRHPGIVRYVAHGTTDRCHYLAMEWLEGESLEDRLERGGLGAEAALSLARRVADALGVAHARGVVHRDVKPGNLFLEGRTVEGVRLIDFGVARAPPVTGLGTRTHSGITIGTPGYMAPEQARGAHDVDARADVFALGCVLFECVTGRAAFVGAHVMAVLAKILLEEAPRASELSPGVPAALDDLIARMLSKDPAERPADGAAAAVELSAVSAALASEGGRVSAVGTEPPTALTRKEQRLVCVLLAGGSLGAQGGGKRPLAAAAATPALRARVAEIRALIAPAGAQVESLADGSVVATLVGTGDATAQVARAARAALALRGALGEATLVLATGRGVLRGRLPIGEVIDRAVSLVRGEVLRGAARGSSPLAEAQRRKARPVRVDEVTAGLLGAGFEVLGDEAGLCLVGERDGLEGARTLLGRATPFVGRRRELAELVARYEACAGGSRACAALVTGPSGVGKSRLRHELLSALTGAGRPPEAWFARAEPVGRGAPFGLLSQVLRREAKLREGEPASSKQQKLVGRLGRYLGAAEAAAAARFLGEICQVPFDGTGDVQLRAARHDPMLMGDQTRRAWEQWLGAELSAGPLVIVVEDLHWGDLPSLAYLDEALGALAGRPLFVLGLARPVVHEVFPALWSGRGVFELQLRPLAGGAARTLVRTMLGDQAPDDRVDAIVERAGGNAFFLEELIRASAAGDGGALPAAVLAIVQARLEALEPEARRALRAASVFGQVFWSGGVERLLGGAGRGASAGELLADLERGELISRRDGSRYAGQEEFEFRDGPVREAAYETLTEADRSLGHALAGAWLEQAGEPSAALLAEHHELGGQPAQAGAFFLRAAAEALDGNDFDAALGWADRAERSGVQGEALGELRLLRAEACRWRGRPAAAQSWALGALELLPRGSERWYRAAAEAAAASGRAGKAELVVQLASLLAAHPPGNDRGAREAYVAAASRAAVYLVRCGRLDLADPLLQGLGAPDEALSHDGPEAAAWLLRARSLRAIFTGHPAAHLALLRASVAAFERAGDHRSAWTQRANVGFALIELGANGDAELLLSDVAAASRRQGLSEVEAMAKQLLGALLGRRAALDEARATEREALSFFSGKGSRRPEGVSRTYLSSILLLAGDRAGARKEAERAIQVLAQSPPAQAHARATLARALLADGDATGALASASIARSALHALGGVDEGEATIRLVHATCLRATGDEAAARAAIAEAGGRLMARASRIDDPTLRQSFLRAVPDNATTLRLVAAIPS
jgi:eukaryotic-like serine/threonine-protein kinase